MGSITIRTSKEFLLFLIVALVAGYFILSAAFDIPFYHHDIYKYSTGSLHRACSGNQGHRLIIAFGRPGAAYLDCLNNKIGNTLASINIMRGLCLILIAAMVSLFALLLRRLGFTQWTALGVSAAIFLLPVTLVTLIMACSSLYAALLLALTSQYLISCSNSANNVLTVKTLPAALLALVFLGLSFFTYPALSAFYLVPAFLLILFKPLSEWQNTRRIVYRDSIIFVAFSLLYFVMAKDMQQMMMIVIPPAYRIDLTFDFLMKIKTILLIMPHLWNFAVSHLQTFVVDVILVLGIICGIRQIQLQQVSVILEAFMAIVILLLLSISVYLVAPLQNMPSTRIIFVFQAMTILLIVWGLKKISGLFAGRAAKLFNSTIFALVLVGAVDSNRLLTQSVLNDYIELNTIVSALSDATLKKLPMQRIHLISSNAPNETGYVPYEDIFNINSSYFGDDATNMVNTAFLQFAQRHTFDLKNCYFAHENGRVSPLEKYCVQLLHPGDIAVTFSHPGEEIRNSTNTLIINMQSNALQHQAIDYRNMK